MQSVVLVSLPMYAIIGHTESVKKINTVLLINLHTPYIIGNKIRGTIKIACSFLLNTVLSHIIDVYIWSTRQNND